MPTTYSWPLAAETPTTPTTQVTTGATGATTTAAQRLASFLGFGLLRPFRRDEKNDFANGGGEALVTARIGQILGTRADSAAGPGELPWRTNFGSRLHILRHKNNNAALAQLAGVIVSEALAAWEKNAVVTGVTVENKDNPRVLLLRVKYKLIDRNGSTLIEGQATVPV